MERLKLLAIIAILTFSLTGCTNSKEEANKIEGTQVVQETEQSKIETPLGAGELIPLKSGSGDILEGQNYLKVVSKDKPKDSDIIKTYNKLNKSDLEFNYFIIQYGDKGIHFVKNSPIGNVGEIDFDCVPLQPGSQLKETKKFLTIDGDKIIEEDATEEGN